MTVFFSIFFLFFFLFRYVHRLCAVLTIICFLKHFRRYKNYDFVIDWNDLNVNCLLRLLRCNMSYTYTINLTENLIGNSHQFQARDCLDAYYVVWNLFIKYVVSNSNEIWMSPDVKWEKIQIMLWHILSFLLFVEKSEYNRTYKKKWIL